MRLSNSRRFTSPVSRSWLAWDERRRLSSRDSLTSWNTSTPPATWPEPSRIGAAVLSTYSSLPSRRMSSIGRTDLMGRMRRTETLSGFSSGSLGSWSTAREGFFPRPPLRTPETPAGQLLGHRVDVVDGRVGIGGDDAVADRLQRDLRALLLAEQRLLVELALGDVEFHAHQAQQAPVLVDARGGAADHPAPLAVAVAHAMGAFEDRRLAGDVVADRGRYARQILRVHEGAPVRRAAHVVVAVTEHRLPARREIHLVAFDVEVPHAVVGRGLKQISALLELGEARLDTDTLKSRGEAGADELHQQLQIHVPRAARHGMREPEETGRLALHPQRHEQRRADVQLGAFFS